jgi:type IV pilus assembly protein PilC
VAIALEPLPRAKPKRGEQAARPAAAPREGGGRPAEERLTSRWRRRVPSGDVTFFLSQLTLILETGTPLAQGLRQISSSASPRMAALARSVVEEIESGSTFARGLARHPEAFSPVEVSMMQVGESGGFLEDMVNRVVDLRHRRERMHGALRSALTYPMVLMVVSFLVLGFMLGFIFPRFERVFQDMGTALPISTRILLAASSVLRERWYFILPGAAALAGGAFRAWRTATVRRAVERVKFSLPYIRDLMHELALSQLFLNLGSLLQAKVPLLSALRVCRGAMGQEAYRELVDQLAESAEHGEGLASSLNRSRLIPGLVKSVAATGEETGRSDRAFLRLAAYYDQQVERRLRILATLLEPAILILMGGFVGFVVISLILPIFRMSRTIH